MKPLELLTFALTVVISLLSVIMFFSAVIRHSHLAGTVSMAIIVVLSIIMSRTAYREGKEK